MAYIEKNNRREVADVRSLAMIGRCAAVAKDNTVEIGQRLIIQLPAESIAMIDKTRLKSVNAALLPGGNPRIPKGYGDGPVQAYIAAMPGWKRDVGSSLDLLISQTIPGVHKAVKWNSPLYGIEGQGWFLGVHCFPKYIKVAFFKGRLLEPMPPGDSKSRETRYVNIRENEPFDRAQFAAWVVRASRLPGEQM